MKLLKLFKKKHHKELTIAEEMDIADSKVWEQTHGDRKFICMYAVVDVDNGFKTVVDGFKTKADAKAYCETCGFNYYINYYWAEM